MEYKKADQVVGYRLQSARLHNAAKVAVWFSRSN